MFAQSVVAIVLVALNAVDAVCPQDAPACQADAKTGGCGAHKKCASCVSDLNCGWCASDGKCVKGKLGGPATVNCTSWDYAFCSGEPCSSYDSCDSCTADALCGWCATTGVCTEGSKDRPVFIQCLARDWRHGPGQCAKCQCPDADGKCPTDGEEKVAKCATPNKAFAASKKNTDLNADPDGFVPDDVIVPPAK